MPLDLSDTLVVGISATALFDLADEDRLFRDLTRQDRDRGIAEYRRRMRETEDVPLDPGTGLPLARALLGLNRYGAGNEPPLVEVVVMSRNSPETGLRVLKAIRQQGLDITRSAFTGGEPVTDYLAAFDVDLFLTTNPADAQAVIDRRACAAALLRAPPPGLDSAPDDQVRIAFDGDAVLFSEAAELVYKTEGLQAFHRTEDEARDVPLPEGPYAAFLKKLARLRERIPIRLEYTPVRLALVTARNRPAELRAIHTFRSWGVYVDMAFFLGGVEKTQVLSAFRPHLFFEDQEVHLGPAAGVVPAGQVPYPSDSPLRDKARGGS